jgi:hypothetical protein
MRTQGRKIEGRLRLYEATQIEKSYKEISMQILPEEFRSSTKTMILGV